METVIGISNRHVHLCQEDIDILFKDTLVEKAKDLLQPNEYATNQTVTIRTEKSSLEKVRVLNTTPVRSYTQVEISKTDAFKLGINPPVRASGNLEGAATVIIEGPNGTVEKASCIIANRHLHINPEDREKYGLTNVEKVSVSVETEKSVIFKDVYIKETPNGVLELHLDTDDGNAALIKTGDMCTVQLDN